MREHQNKNKLRRFFKCTPLHKKLKTNYGFLRMHFFVWFSNTVVMVKPFFQKYVIKCAFFALWCIFLYLAVLQQRCFASFQTAEQSLLRCRNSLSVSTGNFFVYIMEARENISARFLVKKPLAPQGLTSAAQNVLFQSLDKVMGNFN